jgi:hypothetical protein
MEKTWEIFVKESEAHTFIIHTPPIYIGLLRYNTNIFGPKLKGPIHNTKPTKKYTTNPPLIVQLIRLWTITRRIKWNAKNRQELKLSTSYSNCLNCKTQFKPTL